MSRKVLTLFSAIAVLFTAPLALSAQGPTPEGTTIHATVSVSYTDVNGNTYTDATASTDIVVGFKGSVDVNGQASFTPGSPSTGNEAPFTVTNNGNGVDTVSIGTTPSSNITISGYKIDAGATVYANLTALNAALSSGALAGISVSGSRTITVIYSVASGVGGGSESINLAATSTRVGASTDNFSSTVSPVTTTATVSVTATPTSVTEVKTNGTPYTATYDVTNTGNASLTYDLTGGATGTATVVSVNGGVSSVVIGANATVSISVTYNLTGTSGASTVTLTATQNGAVSNTATGTLNITVSTATLTLTKEAYRDNGSGTAASTTLINNTTDRVVPGEIIWYKLSITSGTAPAVNLSLTDALPAEVTYVSNIPAANWTVNEASGTITATRTGNMPASTTEVIYIKVTVK